FMKRLLHLVLAFLLLLAPTVALCQGISTWVTTPSAPAVGSQATTTRAASGTLRHVATCISFSAGATAAPTATNLAVNLRDGTTGAGTILHTWVIIAPATVGTHVLFSQCGFNIAGTAGNAMTL